MKRLFILCAAIIFFPYLNSSQPATLDMTFAKNGIDNYTINQGVGYAASTFSFLTSSGSIVLGGNMGYFLGLVRLKKNGDIDSSFGGDGKIIWSPGIKDYTNYRVGLLQSDNKIIVVGDNNGFTNSNKIYALRFNANGTIDSSFGINGVVIINGNADNIYADAVTIQADGKLIIVGSQGIEGNYQVMVLRLNTNGSLDHGFSHGKILYRISNNFDYGTTVAIQTDGEIIVGGYGNGTGSGYEFSIARLNTNGGFDNSFGSDGKQLIHVGNNGDLDFLSKVLIQNDGKILLAGYSGPFESPADFSIARLSSDGNIDNSFGNNGSAVIPVGTSYDACNDAALQPDGKIIMCGESENTNGNENFSSVRLKSNGIVDSSFGTNGKLLDSIKTTNAASKILLLSTGKMLLTGYTQYDSLSKTRSEMVIGDYAAIRLTANGKTDNTFADNGASIVPPGSFDDAGNAATIAKNGKIFIAGTSLTAGQTYTGSFMRLLKASGSPDSSLNASGRVLLSDYVLKDQSVNAITTDNNGLILTAGRLFYNDNDFFISRYKTTGVPDSNFMNTGFTNININGNDTATCITVQADNKIVVAGNSNGSSGTIISAAKLNTDGTPDNTFNSNGIKTISFGVGSSKAYVITVQPDGKILIAGAIQNNVLLFKNYDFADIRLNANGSYDNTFGSGGKVSIQVGLSDDICYAMQLQSDGKILLAGSSVNNAQTDFAVVRLNANGTTDNTFNSSGKIIITISNFNDVAKSVAIQTDGKIVTAGYTYNGTDNDVAVVRLNANGSLDNTFDADGKAVFNYAGTDEIINAVDIQSDGKILLAGKQKPLNELYSSNYFVMRLIGGNSLKSSMQVLAEQQKINHRVSLTQNFPNPFNNTTTINYALPSIHTSAEIIFTDKNGSVIKTINISEGKGSVQIDASTLLSGAYQYSLYINNKLIDTKQMILSK